jgi:hypothetical protein
MSINSKEYLVGSFYSTSQNYIDRFKIGGKQKLQKLIGEHFLYKRRNDWFWNNSFIISLDVSELKELIDKIKNRL